MRAVNNNNRTANRDQGNRVKAPAKYSGIHPHLANGTVLRISGGLRKGRGDFRLCRVCRQGRVKRLVRARSPTLLQTEPAIQTKRTAPRFEFVRKCRPNSTGGTRHEPTASELLGKRTSGARVNDTAAQVRSPAINCLRVSTSAMSQAQRLNLSAPGSGVWPTVAIAVRRKSVASS